MPDSKSKKSKLKPQKAAKMAKSAPAKTKAAPVSLSKKKPDSKENAATSSKESNKEGKKKGTLEAAIETKQKLTKGSTVQLAPVTSLIKNKSNTDICREVACEGLATSGGYCRLHYIKNWKKIKRKELILKEGKLNRYIEELVAKYPDKYIEAIRQDLEGDREFSKVVSDLELDENIEDFEKDMENVDNLIDSIRRDVDDDGDMY